jgi:hypothetical protein
MNLGVSHASIRSSRIPLTEAADWFTAAWIFRAQFGNLVQCNLDRPFPYISTILFGFSNLWSI